MIEAGRLRKRIILQTATETRNDEGGVVQTWGDTKTIWAEVKPVSGSETTDGDRVIAGIDHLVTVRYFSGLTTPKLRFKYGTRILNIVRILDFDEMKVYAEVGCKEEVL